MNPSILESLRRAYDEPKQSQSAKAEWVVFEDGALDASSKSIEPVGNGSLALIELILKDSVRLDKLIRDPHQQIALLPRFVAISLIGFTFFGFAMALVLGATTVWPKLFPIESVLAGHASLPMRFEELPSTSVASPWLNGNAFRLIVAYSIGLIAATGVCLPSLYFYGLLAGVRMTMMDVVIHALKSKTVAAVTLIGVLPIYAAFGLATAIFPMPDRLRDGVLMLGLILPFIAGLSGTYSLYRGLATLTDTMTAERRPYRECFLRRLVLSWAAVYTAVSPVLIFTLWQRLQG